MNRNSAINGGVVDALSSQTRLDKVTSSTVLKEIGRPRVMPAGVGVVP